MSPRASSSSSACPHCGQGLAVRERRGLRHRPGAWLSRELLLVAGALGLLLGFGWVDDRSSCAGLEQQADAVVARDLALDRFVAAHCDPSRERCEVERLGLHDCQAKIRVRELRRDGYGEVLGTFERTLGLVYSPGQDQWQIDAELADRQILGLPNR